MSKCQLPPNWHLFKISSEIQRMFSFPCTFIGLAFIALTLQGIKEGERRWGKYVLRNTSKFIFTQVITWVEKVGKQQSTVVPFETWTLCWWKPQGLEITPLPELEPAVQIPPNWICLNVFGLNFKVFLQHHHLNGNSKSNSPMSVQCFVCFENWIGTGLHAISPLQMFFFQLQCILAAHKFTLQWPLSIFLTTRITL